MDAKNERTNFDICKELARDLYKLVEVWEERQRTMAAYGTMTHKQYAEELKAVLLKFWRVGRMKKMRVGVEYDGPPFDVGEFVKQVRART